MDKLTELWWFWMLSFAGVGVIVATLRMLIDLCVWGPRMTDWKMARFAFMVYVPLFMLLGLLLWAVIISGTPH